MSRTELHRVSKDGRIKNFLSFPYVEHCVIRDRREFWNDLNALLGVRVNLITKSDGETALERVLKEEAPLGRSSRDDTGHSQAERTEWCNARKESTFLTK